MLLRGVWNGGAILVLIGGSVSTGNNVRMVNDKTCRCHSCPGQAAGCWQTKRGSVLCAIGPQSANCQSNPQPVLVGSKVPDIDTCIRSVGKAR